MGQSLRYCFMGKYSSYIGQPVKLLRAGVSTEVAYQASKWLAQPGVQGNPRQVPFNVLPV